MRHSFELEWRCVVHLARDKVGTEEILNGVKFHRENQARFGLPKGESGYLAAKVFLFRAIYKGSAYAYSVDPDFSWIGNERFWQRTIDAFYEKYNGIRDYHNRIIHEVSDTGKLVVETGREYNFTPKMRRGEFSVSETDICNWPVQGFAADLMTLARNLLRQRLRATDLQYLQRMTVHDSIVLDTGDKRWHNIVMILKSCFTDLQERYEQLFGIPLTVPMDCEIKVGINWKFLHKIMVR